MKRYLADISAGSLMLRESRIIASLLWEGADDATWDHEIRAANVLQKSAVATAVRQARLIRLRLETLDRPAWILIKDGGNEVATQTLFAAAVNHSQLLRDFVREVVADHSRRLEHELSVSAWEPFLSDCMARDSAVSNWTASTRKKLLEVIVRILAEARYLESTRSLKLLPPHLNPLVKNALQGMGKDALVRIVELQHE